MHDVLILQVSPVQSYVEVTIATVIDDGLIIRMLLLILVVKSSMRNTRHLPYNNELSLRGVGSARWLVFVKLPYPYLTLLTLL